MKTGDLERLRASAAEASNFLQAISNEKRLLVLCHLMGGERSVGSLADLVGLSQSALSQHLTRLRADGMVATRREGQTVYYRLADPRVEAVISLLYEQFCRPKRSSTR
ncbi:MAG TPA: metalloregulator ArsR/SmtB family transcription factor [Ferrovibrio sp.]|uniref:ArsR/SmtB family transcription factor n=1 Tax=Ferrovibrio sp. TaxID=1917215 RepID=UPI002B4B9086|nr:metalloregulator ArsR/SmtB family transcription factor [Ferrovibrio sp.]HLT76414.1 metalloregulator ArsR/SmtB family transcription factor [Ferrovibrio sp.]